MCRVVTGPAARALGLAKLTPKRVAGRVAM